MRKAPRRRHQGSPPVLTGARLRAGFTLLEMVLVLTLIATLAGLSWPALQRVYANQELKQSAEDVRRAVVECRLRAIDGGATYQFRYETTKNRYLSVPYEATAQPIGEDGENSLPRDSGEIDEELWFTGVGEDKNAVERIGMHWVEDLPDAHNLASASWSPPVLFYPDGSSSDAAFRITRETGHYIELSVRGLTGAVQVSGVQREDD